MNYASIYNRLIERGKNRILSGYSEQHHILPRCMGGGNEKSNLVLLTAEEHFVAHALLVKIHPSHPRLVYALSMMCMNRDGKRQNNKLYAWHRRRHAEITRIEKTGIVPSLETREKLRAALKGRKRSPETIAKVAAANRGKKRSPDVVERHRAFFTGRKRPPRSQKTKDLLAAAHRGKKRSAETRLKLSIARRRRVISAETRAKTAASMTGKKHSAESIVKMRLKASTRRYTPERLMEMRGRIEKLTPEQRSARAHKAWATKRRKEAEKETNDAVNTTMR
jgi:hypothetical protein